MQDFSNAPLDSKTPASSRRRLNPIWWIMGGVFAVFAFCSIGLLGVVTYFGVYGPETFVYSGNQIPSEYLRTMESVGALDEKGEEILFFYTDGFLDIRDGFYFVSNKKVVIYAKDTDSPLTTIPLEEISEVELYREESFFVDSQITLLLKNGEYYALPVSSEVDGDERFFAAIQDRTNQTSEDNK